MFAKRHIIAEMHEWVEFRTNESEESNGDADGYQCRA
jgi:hypothetical protein